MSECTAHTWLKVTVVERPLGYYYDHTWRSGMRHSMVYCTEIAYGYFCVYECMCFAL